MKRLSKTMWATFNTHGFAGVFRKPNTEELRNPALQALWEPIGRLYGQSCDMCWALIDLEKDVGWKRKNWQYSWIVQLVLERLRQHDEQVLDLIKQAIAILEQ